MASASAYKGTLRKLSFAALRFTRQTVSFAVRAGCALAVVHEALCWPSDTYGASMMPTISMGGERVLRVNLHLYRLIGPYLPAHVAPAFHHSEFGNARTMQPSTIGIQQQKMDPSMGMGLTVGDLVVVGSRNRAQVEVCKRIVGLAGDTVLVDPRLEPSERHARLWQDGQQRRTTDSIEHPHVSATYAGEPRYIAVPPGHVWLVGDNLGNSTDSRDYGPVPLGLVRGRVVAKVWPLSQAGWLSNSMRLVQ